jgi:hypothetical protein
MGTKYMFAIECSNPAATNAVSVTPLGELRATDRVDALYFRGVKVRNQPTAPGSIWRTHAIRLEESFRNGV